MSTIKRIKILADEMKTLADAFEVSSAIEKAFPFAFGPNGDMSARTRWIETPCKTYRDARRGIVSHVTALEVYDYTGMWRRFKWEEVPEVIQATFRSKA